MASKPEVLIYQGNPEYPTYRREADYWQEKVRQAVAAGARAVHWEPFVFLDATEALAAFDVHKDALITSLGNVIPATMAGFPAHPLLERSEELLVPRLIISHHGLAGEFVRPDSQDDRCMLYDMQIDQVPAKIAGWLAGLGVTSIGE